MGRRKKIQRVKLVVSDADALIALAHKDDSNHDKALVLSSKLAKKGVRVVCPNTAIVEAITALKRALNLPKESALVNEQYQKGVFIVEYVNEEIQMLSSQIYEKAVSKQNTAFDAIVAATAQKLKADAIFSFDGWYTKMGFKLVKDLV